MCLKLLLWILYIIISYNLILEIPVFSVLTKSDKCDLSQKGLEKKKKDIAEAISIDADKILICENYQPNQKPDSRDVEILEFLTKVYKSRFESIFLINWIISSLD